MFNIIQSHRTEYLVQQLLMAYQAKDVPIFEEFVVIVPSMVLGDWLDKSIASKAGISTLVTTKFWGQYQWTLMQKVLASYNQLLEQSGRNDEVIGVPEVAVLTGAVMQWRLFGYFTYFRADIMSNDAHPLYPIVAPLLDSSADDNQKESRLWSLATDFARVFGRYLTHREDWLDDWSAGVALDVAALIQEKDELSLRFDKEALPTPEWLLAHYLELEAAQRYLWQLLFAPVYQHRGAIETRFWQLIEDDLAGAALNIRAMLPRQLHIFTIQQLPQNELDFLYRLSSYLDITLLHYNPSQLFWADIVDKQWLQRQKIINPESVFLSDYGHTLLSRLGKQSRETFAMLANLSGNEYYDEFKLNWQNKFDVADDSTKFDANQPLTLLAQLQQDVLMLDERATQQATVSKLSAAIGAQLALDFADGAGVGSELPTSELPKNSLSENVGNGLNNTSNNDKKTTPELIENSQSHQFSDEVLSQKFHAPIRKWPLSQFDNSLSIHSCHSLQRQLEVLRSMIGRWLNDKNADGSERHLSDIVVLLPDVERHYDLISAVFVNGQGQDGLTLPAKVTGVVDKSIRQLWEAISGFYRLLGSDSSRFEANSVFDWLMLPPLYESLGLTHDQMSRGCDLLIQAGFIRGFDEAHLKQSLDNKDYDYRFSFAFALDQIALGLVMPEAGMSDCLYPKDWKDGVLAEKTRPLSAISLDDAPIVEALCRIHSGIQACRNKYQERHKAEDWLAAIEDDIIHPYFGKFDQTPAMRTVFKAMNGFKGSLRANHHYQRYQLDNQSDQRVVEARLSKVSNLPLKLSFMLDSIEDELENQQVSAEPTGVITFGRFGALRNVPFGLVVMLNMDLAEFPNRDRDNRYDLMKAGRSRRGDRLSEDDDNGAFLDALLCARSACWIFYNGQRTTDTYEHLPANPVSELLQFLQGEVDWQWSQWSPKTAIDEDVQRQMSKLIEKWFVTQHPALPFADEVFLASNLDLDDNKDKNKDKASASTVALLNRAMQDEKLAQKQNTAPPRVWQNVFERLHDTAARQHLPVVTLPSQKEYQGIAEQLDFGIEDEALRQVSHVDLQYLYLQVRHPAKHFLRSQNIHIVQPSDDLANQEPLSLGQLGAFTVNDTLIADLYQNQNQNGAHDLLYHPVMPAGVARQSTLNFQQLALNKRCQAFLQTLEGLGIEAYSPLDNGDNNKLPLITPSAETIVSLQEDSVNTEGQLTLKGLAPISAESAPKVWLNMLPNSAQAPQLLKFWLMHLFWQVSRNTRQDQVAANDGQSIWSFKPSQHGAVFSLAPITYEAALAELVKWIRFSQLAGQIPMAILPSFALQYLDNLAKDPTYQPRQKDFSRWLSPDFGSDMLYDTCSKHELWQYLLQSQDAFLALKHALIPIAPVLFGAMQSALTAHELP